jgi:hypothetical protein
VPHIEAMAIIKSMIEAGKEPTVEDVRRYRAIVDEVAGGREVVVRGSVNAGGANVPAPAGGPMGNADEYTVDRIKDWGDNVSILIAGGPYHGQWVKFYDNKSGNNASDARHLNKGDAFACIVTLGNNGKTLFGSKIRPAIPPSA